ncbi:[citrate (pro-3S)-lyase] ligase [Candidatus Phytoplasma australasiaticum]|uniref:[citrate (pro-3S)-lyase] ligase n=1 Tax=Candidatus Phytoplasma australasiaticum TaxID=2754999 RepID=UPI0027125BFE|nr:[citrate (pro-3S)-lyase] ligase [Candidatus Phytoplasma australasiaticum]MDO8060565.1 [citrate (pro-3S)-lyase] ligase [Candidatus Phytoplasma australasiaticum]
MPKIVTEKDINEILSIQKLLFQNSLTNDLVHEYVIIKNLNDKLIGVVGRYYNNIRCLAVDPEYQGYNLSNALISYIIKRIYQDNFNEIFVFTKPVNFAIFKYLGFRMIYCNEEFGFLTNRYDCFEEYLSYLSDLRKNNIKSNFKNISAIVMNANPFTKGHQYLVETASNNSDLVYIIMVKEDVSLFSYKQRKEMVKLFTENIKNVFIVEGSNYLVSRNVFPSYFLSSPEKVIRSQIILDTHIFKNYIARNLGIKKRYVGEEPFSPTTNLYNVIMQEILVKSEIELVVCPRLMWDFKPISATQVRKLFITGNFKDMKNLVPTTTLKFLQKLNYKKYAQDPKLSKLIDKSF